MSCSLVDLITTAHGRYDITADVAEKEARAQLADREAVTGMTINPEQIPDRDAEAIWTGLIETLRNTDARPKLFRIAHAAHYLEVCRVERDAAIRDAAVAGISCSHIADAAGLSRTSIYRIIRKS